jgi:hypothetical protein
MRSHPIDGDASAIQPTAPEEVIPSLFYKKGKILNWLMAYLTISQK